jgi:hypothetical protein
MSGSHRTSFLAAGLAALVSLAFSISSVAAGDAKPQGLWVGGFKYFSEFQGNALKQSGTPKANLAFGSFVYNGPTSMAFDRHQNLWAVFQSINDNLAPPALEITRQDFALLKARQPVKAKVIISSQGNSPDPFRVPESIGFDSAGDLWVNDWGKRLVELLPSQIEKSGSPTPNIVLTSPNSVPTQLRFDGSDNLWVVEFPLPFSTHTMIWRFAPADRTVSGPSNPSLIVHLSDPLSVDDFSFDGAGNLWLAGRASNGDELEMISASNLSGSGEIFPPGTIITSAAFGSSYDCLGGIDFDHLGDLWVSVGTDICGSGTVEQQVVEFTPGQLSAGGNLTPSVVIGRNPRKTNIFFPDPLRFGPTVP